MGYFLMEYARNPSSANACHRFFALNGLLLMIGDVYQYVDKINLLSFSFPQ